MNSTNNAGTGRVERRLCLGHGNPAMRLHAVAHSMELA